MPFYYYLFLCTPLPIIILSIRSLVLRKKNLPVELFADALRNENNGHYEEALITYENALAEFTKTRSHNNLKRKIIEKLKLLHTIIEYKNSFLFINRV